MKKIALLTVAGVIALSLITPSVSAQTQPGNPAIKAEKKEAKREKREAKKEVRKEARAEKKQENKEKKQELKEKRAEKQGRKLAPKAE
jgi:Ni/Co efflux regulator RcnB